MSIEAYTRDPQIEISGIKIDLRRKGSGPPLIFLQALEGWIRDERYSDLLAQQFEVLLPQHPGFGQSELPRWFRSVNDYALFYLDLLEQLNLRDVVLVGSSFGGWLASEVAIRSTERVGKLVLVDALGIKVGGRDDRDIADIYAMTQAQVAKAFYHDPEKNRREVTKLPDYTLKSMARSRETMCFFGWQPYMHNPTLKNWLHRIKVPTQVIWGRSDGVVSPDYGRAYAAAIPGAQFSLIEEAGHYPHLEQPEQFANIVRSFCAKGSAPVRKVS